MDTSSEIIDKSMLYRLLEGYQLGKWRVPSFFLSFSFFSGFRFFLWWSYLSTLWHRDGSWILFNYSSLLTSKRSSCREFLRDIVQEPRQPGDGGMIWNHFEGGLSACWYWQLSSVEEWCWHCKWAGKALEEGSALTFCSCWDGYQWRYIYHLERLMAMY